METLPASERSARATGSRCEVHVGRIQDLRTAHLALLSDPELARARQYRLAADTDRSLLGAVLLRLAAARHLGIRPDCVPVDRTCGRCGAQHGRPQLPGNGLQASVSHSGDVVAVAITSAGPVGVDVEAVRSIDFAAVIQRVCTPGERNHVHAAADFFTFWTRKEAVLKATGEGLHRPMTDLEVASPGSAPVLLRLGAGAPPACQMSDISVGNGYQACVAVLATDPVTISTLHAGELLASCLPVGTTTGCGGNRVSA